jgi:uncharacterized protein YpiB (UPF0302 family)
MKRQDLVQDHLLSLFAEMILDRAVQEFKQQKLYERIDHALAIRDEATFLQLSEQWRELLVESGKFVRNELKKTD